VQTIEPASKYIDAKEGVTYHIGDTGLSMTMKVSRWTSSHGYTYTFSKSGISFTIVGHYGCPETVPISGNLSTKVVVHGITHTIGYNISFVFIPSKEQDMFRCDVAVINISGTFAQYLRCIAQIVGSMADMLSNNYGSITAANIKACMFSTVVVIKRRDDITVTNEDSKGKTTCFSVKRAEHDNNKACNDSKTAIPSVKGSEHHDKIKASDDAISSVKSQEHRNRIKARNVIIGTSIIITALAVAYSVSRKKT
jgi:hypothetical protein